MSSFLLFAAFTLVFFELHGDGFNILSLVFIFLVKFGGLLGLFEFEVIFLGRFLIFFLLLIFLDLLHKGVNNLPFGERSVKDRFVIEFDLSFDIDGEDGLRLYLVVLSDHAGAHFNG